MLRLLKRISDLCWTRPATVLVAVGLATLVMAAAALLTLRLETDIALAFMRAYRASRQYVIEAPAEEIAHKEADFFPGIDKDVLSHTIATYQKLGCWSPDPAISQEAYNNLLDVFLYSGLISKRYPYDACVITPPDA